MRKLSIALTGLLLSSLLVASETYAKRDERGPDILALTASPQWLTTKVYIEGEPQIDVKANYPNVVGLSMWDTQRNRYEFFDHKTGASKLANGGGGYFLITGDGEHHILVPDIGTTRTYVRRLEKLDSSEFTYSREVPRDMVANNPPVRIYVVHAPYTGPIKTLMSE